MSKIAQVGDYCPNEECPDYSKLQTKQVKPNIKKSGFSQAGKQRFKCKTCQRTFTETKGTIFYRKRTPTDEIIDALAWVAEGVRVSSHMRVKGHKEDTVIG